VLIIIELSPENLLVSIHIPVFPAYIKIGKTGQIMEIPLFLGIEIFYLRITEFTLWRG